MACTASLKHNSVCEGAGGCVCMRDYGRYIFCRLTEELDGKYAPVYAVCVGRWQSSHVRVRKVLDGSRDERLFKVVARGQ